jgi:hypothetical protein
MLRDTPADELFFSLAKGTMGDGQSILFWLDRWVDGERIIEIAPEVLAVVRTRCKNKRLVADAIPDSNWLLDVRGQLSTEGYLQLIRHWIRLRGFTLQVGEADHFTWTGSASGRYTAKETYSILCQGG